MNGWMLNTAYGRGWLAGFEKAGVSFLTTLALVKNGVSPRNTQGQMHDLRLTERASLRGVPAARLRDDAAELEASLGDGFSLFACLRFLPDWVEMDVRLRYSGDTPQRVRYLEWRTESIERARYPEAELFGPGTMPVMDEPIDLTRRLSRYRSENIISHVATGAAPHNSSGVMGAYEPERGVAHATWFLSEWFPCGTSSLARDKRLTRTSVIDCPRMMQKGDEMDVGTFFFGAKQATRAEATHAFAKSFARMGWDTDADAGALRALNLLEVYRGEKSARTLFDFYDQLTKELPRIAALGFNAIEVMPGFPTPSYSIVDFFDVQATYGDAEGLRRLVAEAHRLGMRVVFDMVFHGPRDFSSPGVSQARSYHLDAHPDWFIRTEFGAFAKTYTRAFDLACPEYQAHIADAMRYYLREWGADGFRLDAQNWNSFPNWDERTGRQPYETLLAGYRMMDEIRRRVLAEFPNAFFYTEARAPGAGHGHEYRYNYDYHWLYPSLCKVVDPRGMAPMVHNYASENTMSWPDAALWCEENAWIQPRGLVTMQQVDSHDSAEWAGYVGGQYNREAFGDAAFEVLFGMAAFLGGGMMALWRSFDGHEEYVGKILRLRLEHPALRAGECFLRGLRADDAKTVTILWKKDRSALGYVGNLEGEAKTVCLTVEPDLLPAARAYRVRDLLTGDEFPTVSEEARRDGFALSLAPHGRFVLEFTAEG